MSGQNAGARRAMQIPHEHCHQPSPPPLPRPRTLRSRVASWANTVPTGSIDSANSTHRPHTNTASDTRSHNSSIKGLGSVTVSNCGKRCCSHCNGSSIGDYWDKLWQLETAKGRLSPLETAQSCSALLETCLQPYRTREPV